MRRIWQDLRRRKLVQWAVAYLAAAWLVLQVLDVLAEPWSIPAGVLRAVGAGLAFGGAAVLVLAWFHGERGSQRASIGEVVLLLLIALGAAIVVPTLAGPDAADGPGPAAGPAPGTDGRPRVAVLPFENLGDPADQYFADGMTEEIATRLAGIDGLWVVSRNSARRFGADTASVAAIGRALGTEYLLTGTIRTDRAPGSDGRVRVVPKLVRVADDVHLWTDRFDATLTPGRIFAAQGAIAASVASALDVTLLEGQRAALAAPPTEQQAALEAYMLGRYHWNRRDEESLLRAEEHFRRALAIDSSYARAWSGLADALAARAYNYTNEGARALYEQVGQAGRRALALDSTLTEAWTSVAAALHFGEWDFDDAEAAYLRAIEADPAYSVARYWYAELLYGLGRREEAGLQARRAVEVDPLSPVAQSYAGWMAMKTEPELAVPAFRKAMELAPEWPDPVNGLAITLAWHGRMAEAVSTAERLAALLSDDAPTRTFATGYTRGLAGTATPAEAIDAARIADGLGMPDYAVAVFYASAGLPDSAIARLRSAYDRHADALPYALEASRPFLTGQPAYEELRGRVGLDD